MSHLIELYAKDLGVQIEHRPQINEHYYPVSSGKYITIHNSNKLPSKNYSYWNEVVSILKPELKKRNIDIIQVGTEEDPKILGVDKFFNNTSFNQSFFIIKKSLCHVGIDSCPVHIASSYNIPTVSIYAHTYSSTCDPVWNKNKAIVIESNRNGNKPSFSNSENPKTIDFIKPEEIANSVFESLNFDKYKSIESLYIGDKFLEKKVDILLSELPKVSIPENCEVRIRMDLTFDENKCYEFLSKFNRKVTIITDKTLSLNLLKIISRKIDTLEYISKEFDEDFIKAARSLAVNLKLKCTDKKNLAIERSKNFDFEIDLDSSKDDAKQLREEMVSKIDEKEIKAFSGKYYINGDKVFTFIGESKNDLNFWIDFPHFLCYKEVEHEL
jgi:hypothetical protein